jgi:uncharacterized membrane protein (UPF0127 family)
MTTGMNDSLLKKLTARCTVVMLCLCMIHAAHATSSIVFSRDTLLIETTVTIPVTRPASVVPAPDAREKREGMQDVPTNSNAVTKGTREVAPPASPVAPVMVTEDVTTTQQHQFFVTVNDADARDADWILDLAEIKDDFGVMYSFATPSPASVPPSESEQAFDILFIGSYGNIVAMAQDIIASTLAEPIEVKTPVKGLLYLASGTVKRLGITRKDKVIHPLFPDAPNVEGE